MIKLGLRKGNIVNFRNGFIRNMQVNSCGLRIFMPCQALDKINVGAVAHHIAKAVMP